MCEKRWYAPIISCVALIGKNLQDGSAITKSDIIKKLNEIPRETRERRFGRKYAYPYAIEEKLRNSNLLDELSNKLGLHFEYTCLVQTEGDFTILNNQAQSKRIFEVLELESLLPPLQSSGEIGESGESGEILPSDVNYVGEKNQKNSPDSPNSPFHQQLGGRGVAYTNSKP